MTPDTASVAELRSEVLAGLTERERIVAADGRSLRPGDEQALGRQLIVEAMDRRVARAGDRRGTVSAPWRRGRRTLPTVPCSTHFSASTGSNASSTIQPSRTSTRTAAMSSGSVTQMAGTNRVEPIADSDDEMIEMLRTIGAAYGHRRATI